MHDAEKAEKRSKGSFGTQSESPREDFKHRLFAAIVAHRKAAIVIFAIVAVLFVLPGFLCALDGLIAKTTYKAGFPHPRPNEPGGCASRTAEHARQ